MPGTLGGPTVPQLLRQRATEPLIGKTVSIGNQQLLAPEGINSEPPGRVGSEQSAAPER